MGKDIREFNRGKSPLHCKSYDFSIRIVNMVRYIDCSYNESSLLRQVLRSGTAIGALVREAEFAQSPADFINKLHIALKECNETLYWLNVLKDTEIIEQRAFDSIATDCEEVLALLISSIKTSKNRYVNKGNNE